MNFKKEQANFGKLFLLVVLMIVIQIAVILLIKNKLYFIVSATAYLYFHLILELITIIVGFIIFYYANEAYNQTGSNRIRIIGWAFLIMAIIDIFHTIAYKGFPNILFQPGSNVGIWFWLPARFIGSFLLLVSSFYSLKKGGSGLVNFLKYLVMSFVIILIPLVIYNTFNNILPRMFIEGQGLTDLKIFSEYFVMILFGIAAINYCFILYKNQNKTLLFFIFGLVSSVFSELAFTMYINVFDSFNMTGHVLKAIAYMFFLVGLLYSINYRGKK